jgi:hypothetical protein
MTLNAQCLQIGQCVGASLMQGNDVIDFEVVFGVRFIALLAGEVISLEDVESSFCSALSFEVEGDWFPSFRHSNCFHTSVSS